MRLERLALETDAGQVDFAVTDLSLGIEELSGELVISLIRRNTPIPSKVYQIKRVKIFFGGLLLANNCMLALVKLKPSWPLRFFCRLASVIPAPLSCALARIKP